MITFGLLMQAIRCIRDSQRGQTIMSTLNTLSSCVAHGIHRRLTVFPRPSSSYATLWPLIPGQPEGYCLKPTPFRGFGGSPVSVIQLELPRG